VAEVPALNYTTKIAVSRSIAEIQAMLGEHGASGVMVRFADRAPVGVTFSLTGPHGDRAFALPVDVAAVHRLLLKQEAAGEFRSLRRAAGTFSSPEHAARVAWRVAKDWLEAQLAVVEAHMATLDQAMLPYLVTDERGTTLYELYARSEQAALEVGYE
jgi:hypothetical protein